MTLGLMNHFGVVTQFDSHQIRIPHTQYVSQAYTIENDWSGATFFYAMAMLKPSHIELNHLSQNSLQGDAWIVTLASYFGVQSTFTKDTLIIQSANTAIYSGPPILDFIHHPDMAIPIIVCCALKWNNVQLCGLTHLEYKESKRLTALQTELLKIGIELVYNNDLLRFKKIENFILPSKVHFDTYDDHRLAMALSMVSLQGIDVELKDIDCVKKSFPNFWNEIKKLGYIQA